MAEQVVLVPPLTAPLAEFWSRARYDDLPEAVVRAAKRFLLDTVAAGVAGANTEASRAVASAIRRLLADCGGPARLWGRNDLLPPPQAALINGTSAHARELDDFGGCGHSGAVVISAACAAADALGASGSDLLLSIVAGYDVAARVTDAAGGYRMHNERGWHSTGTCGSFGAAAAVAKLLHLQSDQFASALGIAGSFTGGIWAFAVDGAMTKRFHPGKAAENGLVAAYLADDGMTGPRYILEAEWGGFLGTYAGEAANRDAVSDGLGKDFRILQSGIKPYACCRGIHSVLDALFELMEEGAVTRETVTRMTVHGSDQTVRQFRKHHVSNVLDAQFSMPYSLAVALDSGRATVDQYSPVRADSSLETLIARVDVVADTPLGEGEEPFLEVELRDGTAIRRHVPIARGAAKRPLTDEELSRKATALTEPVLGGDRAREIVASIGSLEDVKNIHALTNLLGHR